MKTSMDVLDHLTYRVEPYSDDPEDVSMLLSSIENYAKLTMEFDVSEDDSVHVANELKAIIECAAQASAQRCTLLAYEGDQHDLCILR